MKGIIITWNLNTLKHLNAMKIENKQTKKMPIGHVFLFSNKKFNPSHCQGLK